MRKKTLVEKVGEVIKFRKIRKQVPGTVATLE